MKYIKLTKGKLALVDDEVFEDLSKYRWRAKFNNNTKSFYAISKTKDSDGKEHFVQMHRYIMKVTDSKVLIDHKDNNSLNNQISNLRITTNQMNQGNRRKSIGCSSIYKGVCWSKRNSKFVAYIKICNKTKYLGYFHLEIDAAKAYNEAAIRHFGEFALLNII